MAADELRELRRQRMQWHWTNRTAGSSIRNVMQPQRQEPVTTCGWLGLLLDMGQ